jgi:hypothetical protein
MAPDTHHDNEVLNIPLTTMKKTGSSNSDKEVTERLLNIPESRKDNLNTSDNFSDDLNDWIDIPWYKKPSVSPGSRSHLGTVVRKTLLTSLDLLPPPALLVIHHRLRLRRRPPP